MNDTEVRVLETIRVVFSNKGLQPPPLTLDTKLDNSLGLESIDFAELVVRLEGQFERDPFASGEMPIVDTVRDLARLYAT